MRRAAEPYGSGAALVFDTSAWNRQRLPTVLPRWQATFDAGLLAVCPVVALKLLAGARDEPSSMLVCVLALRRAGPDAHAREEIAGWVEVVE